MNGAINGVRNGDGAANSYINQKQFNTPLYLANKSSNEQSDFSADIENPRRRFLKTD